MSFTGIEIVPQVDGTTVTVDTIDGSALPSHAQVNGILPVAVGCWGIAANGQPYFDPAGASTGQQAVMGYDVNVGCLFLETATDPPALSSMMRLRSVKAQATHPDTLAALARQPDEQRARRRAQAALGAEPFKEES